MRLKWPSERWWIFEFPQWMFALFMALGFVALPRESQELTFESKVFFMIAFVFFAIAVYVSNYKEEKNLEDLLRVVEKRIKEVKQLDEKSLKGKLKLIVYKYGYGFNSKEELLEYLNKQREAFLEMKKRIKSISPNG